MSVRMISRRQLLGSAVTTAAAIAIIPSYALGGPGKKPPSDVITRGAIGTGGRGGGFVLPNRDGEAPTTLAVCDVDGRRLDGAIRKARTPCEGYRDFRRVLDRKDIDVVYIATPPHWHALISIAAAQAGKDVYCEKPMTKFIGEGRAVVETMKRYRRIFQIGTFGRFGVRGNDRTRKIMRSGVIQGNAPIIRPSRSWKVRQWSGRPHLTPQAIPEQLDYNMWLGPAPVKPYHPHRVHGSFRGYWDYDGGGLSDMGQHFLDGPQYQHAKDDTGPVEIEASAPQPQHPDAVRMWGWVTLKYADGLTWVFQSNEWGEPCPLASRGIPALTPEQEKIVDAVPDSPKLFGQGQAGFEEAVKLREQCGGNAEAAQRCSTLMHLANIAIRLGRKLEWNPEKEQFVGDDQANEFVNIPMRAPWHL